MCNAEQFAIQFSLRKMPRMPITRGHGFRGLKSLWPMKFTTRLVSCLMPFTGECEKCVQRLLHDSNP